MEKTKNTIQQAKYLHTIGETHQKLTKNSPKMTRLTQFLSFFSLPVLDTRLKAPNDPKLKSKIVQRATSSRWNTLEFKFYWCCFLVIVPLLYKTAMDASNETNANYPKFERLLSQGWMFGRKVDNSDSQYRFFRDNFFLLAALVGGHVGLRKLVNAVSPVSRTAFDFVFGLIFLGAIHGVNAIRLLLHVLIMFSIARLTQSSTKLAKLAIWCYGIGSLFINDRYRTVQFGSIWSPLAVFDPGFKGIVERWDVFYNFTLLRTLSFNLDYINRFDGLKQKFLKKNDEEGDLSTPTSPNLKGIVDNERERINARLPIEEYNLFNYISYIAYAPLFIAGPIITFNDFYLQSRFTLPSINIHRNFIYGLRFLFCVLVMEFLLHFMYVVAVSKTGAWEGDTPFQISMIGLFNLNIIWLKLLIPWRLFRLWSLLDGIDPPENMIRCMDNNYSALKFWKGWHRSFNKFVVKYVYIPLGGESNRILASLAVFTFVAIWHDIELKLLLWGWLIVLFLLPEYFATQYFKRYQNEWWFRHLCAFGGVINIWLMIIANLFGFCLGEKGTKALINEMFGTVAGVRFFIGASIALFIAVQVMFELREDEKRRGIDVKC